MAQTLLLFSRRSVNVFTGPLAVCNQFFKMIACSVWSTRDEIGMDQRSFVGKDCVSENPDLLEILRPFSRFNRRSCGHQVICYRLEESALSWLHAPPKRRVHDQQAWRTQWIKPVGNIEAKRCQRRT